MAAKSPRAGLHDRSVNHTGGRPMSVSTKPFGEAWITDYFAMADRRDPDEMSRWYTDDGTFTASNHTPAKGKAAIVATLTQFFSAVTAMRHEKTGCWSDASSGVFEAIAHFETKDRRSLALPAISTMRMKGGLIERFLFVMDATPLLPVAAKA
jgi:streptogramin lyase